MANNNVHHPSCDLNLRRDSGFTADRHNRFIARYRIVPFFDLGCLGCCEAYLTLNRAYRQQPDQFDYVAYNSRNALPEVSCFVRVPKGGGVRGQIATEKDPNLGIFGVRSFADSRTYQMYPRPQDAELNVLSLGVAVPSRKESVAIDVVERSELSAVYFNYADAALAEMYRATKNLRSLEGFCAKKERSDDHASGGATEGQPPRAQQDDVDSVASELDHMAINTG